MSLWAGVAGVAGDAAGSVQKRTIPGLGAARAGGARRARPAGSLVKDSIRSRASANVPDVTDAQVISVNVGQGKNADWAGRLNRTAIDKRPVTGPVAVRSLGLAGDEQVDKPGHGGDDQAVYGYAREDLDWWVERLGRELLNGTFGENITTTGLDVSGSLIGEIWRLGTSLVQITSVRTPCSVFAGWMDETQWVKRFAAARRPGAYLRVLEEGHVRSGDTVAVVDRPAEHLTVAEAMSAYYGDADLMRRLLRVEGRGNRWDEIGVRVLGGAATHS
jgi:MOSC domain-containing protein YiiM